MGYEVISLDKVKRTKPDFVVDILEWPYWEYFQPGNFDLITASVPCNEYSSAKTIGERDMQGADKIVRKTLEIIEYFAPEKWWIENPRKGYLKSRNILDKYPHIDLDYCQFSDWGYNKPTRFWGSSNVVDKPSLVCDFATCPNLVDGPKGRKRHKHRLGGFKMKFSTRQKGRIPERVVEYLLEGTCSPIFQGKKDRKPEKKWVPKLDVMNIEEKKRAGNVLGGEPPDPFPTPRGGGSIGALK
jgi:hypothetical protein